MTSRRTLFVLAVSLLVFMVPASGQQSSPAVTFQSEVSYVDVDAIVTDRQGKFVADLRKDDFEVFEDGKAQKVDTFTLVDIPVERQDRILFSGQPAPTDVQTNRQAFSGHMYVIVLDDADISSMRTLQTRKAAREFVEKYFGANDTAAVVYTSGRTDAGQEFTSDPQLLLAAIDKFVGKRLRSPLLEYIDRMYQIQLNNQSMSVNNDDGTIQAPSVGGDTVSRSEQQMRGDELERQFRADSVLNTLTSLANFLSSVRGRRKSVLLFSEGIDYPLQDVFGQLSDTQITLRTRDAIAAAAGANVNIFAIDPRGLVGLTDEYLAMNASVGSGGVPTEGGGDPRLVFTGAQAFRDELRLSQNSLRSLADETGGLATVDTNALGTAFEKIVQANSRYYVLGYYPASHPRDGRFHKITVRVKRSDVSVVARKGYASPRGKPAEAQRPTDDSKRSREGKNAGLDNNTSPQLRELLTRPIQQSGLSLAMQAAPFKGSGKEAAVALAIDIDGGALQFAPQRDNTYADTLELSFYTVNSEGKMEGFGARSELNLNLRPETYERVKAAGLRVNPRLTLPPGRYQIRVGTRETGAGRAGSVFYNLEVPDFSKEPLMLSGLLLSAPSANQTVSAQPDPVAARLLPGTPTSRRDFVQTDSLSVATEVYDNSSPRQPRQIDISVRLLSETGGEAFASRDTLTNAGDAKKWDTYVYTRAIPLNDVSPGRYLVRVEAQIRGEKDAKPAVRETLISIR